MSATPDPVQGPPRQKRQRLDSFKNPQPRLPPGGFQSGQSQQAKTPSLSCTNPVCKSSNIGEEDGNMICQDCGTVVTEANIVSEVQWAETHAGGHIALGAYIGSDQSHAIGGIAGLRNSGSSSRDIAEANGKRYINQVGTALLIPQNILDSGINVFKLAAAANFIQGRTTRSVAAVALYIACRLRENDNTFMLIDFADILQLNVFKLGQVYKSLLDDLRINGNGFRVHPLNPETLIWRFASRLELGNKTTQVANDAVRIVQRMHRDWMTPGRRPAGICGAALIIAARMNNFQRTVREMVYTVKVTEITLMKRLEEFSKTESGGLTVEEFRRIDLERFENPPAFGAEKKKPGRKRKLIELDDDGDTDLESQRATSATPSTATPSTAAPSTTASSTRGKKQLRTPANTQKKKSSKSQSMPPPPIPIDPQLGGSEPPTKKRRGRPPKSNNPPTPKTPAPITPRATQGLPPDIATAIEDPNSLSLSEVTAFARALDCTTSVDDDQQQQTTTISRGPIAMTEDISDSEFGPDDAELRNCLLSASECEIKTRIWTHENRDWIRTQAAKELKQRLAEANGTAPQIKKRVRHRTRMGDMRAYRREENGDEEEDSMPATGPADAVGKMLKKRGYSRKINYEAVSRVYEPSSRGSSSRRESVSESPAAQSPGAMSPGAVIPSAASPPPAAAVEENPGRVLSMLAPRKITTRATTTRATRRKSTQSPAPPAIEVAAPMVQEDEVDENDIANDGVPIQIDDDGADDDDGERNPEDYYSEGPEDGGEGQEEEEEIDAILEAARRGAGEEDEE
ncbi:MAG: hypothetical protein Q9195_009514 [Heterodermia aff. obscurata]